MISYNFNKNVHLETLTLQVKQALPSLSHITKLGPSVFIWFTSSLTLEEQTTLQEIVENHDPLDNLDFVRGLVSSAADFGREITITFAAENVAMGITQQGKTKLIADVCKDAMYYLQTGSLYEAEAEMGRIEVTEDMSPFLTELRIKDFRNKIRSYLGITLL
jgi:hypothetical protein